MAYMTSVYLSQIWLSKTNATSSVANKVSTIFLNDLKIKLRELSFLKYYNVLVFLGQLASMMVLALLALMFKGAILCHS